MRFALVIIALCGTSTVSSASPDMADGSRPLTMTVHPSGIEAAADIPSVADGPSRLDAMLARRTRESEAQFRAICRGCLRAGQEPDPTEMFYPLETLGAARMR